jgi:hypothetical protein
LCNIREKQKILLKPIIFIFICISFLSCQDKCISKSPVLRLKFKNYAKHYYGGIDSLNISDKNEIEFISNELKKLRSEINKSNLVKSNYGFVQIDFSNSACENEEYFSLIFTEQNGNIIRYSKGNYGTEKYYKNEKLTERVLKLMKLNKSITE